MDVEALKEEIKSLVEVAILVEADNGFLIEDQEDLDAVMNILTEGKVRIVYVKKGKSTEMTVDRSEIPALLKKGKVKVLYDVTNSNKPEKPVKYISTKGKTDEDAGRMNKADAKKELKIHKYSKIRSNWRTTPVK